MIAPQPQPGIPVALPMGIFTLSLDFELIWGKLDKPEWPRFRDVCARERDVVVDRLLGLFSEYDIPATWCTVGHLFLDRCGPSESARHSGIACAAGGEHAHIRLARDPGTSEDRDPLFYGRELIERVRRCPTPQEIGNHTFTHVVADERVCTAEVMDAELEASTAAARALGLKMTSFAFPRNRIRHVGLLARHGFTAFRGQDMVWYERTPRRRWYHRAGHLYDVVAAGTPSAVLPVWHREGIWEIPGSMLYTPSYGCRRVLPASWRVCRAKSGIEDAVRTRRIFHLWFHPTDVVVRMDDMLNGLREIFETVSDLRRRGELQALPMAGIVDLLAAGDKNRADSETQSGVAV
jgi:hypothetical protein